MTEQPTPRGHKWSLLTPVRQVSAEDMEVFAASMG